MKTMKKFFLWKWKKRFFYENEKKNFFMWKFFFHYIKAKELIYANTKIARYMKSWIVLYFDDDNSKIN